MTKQPTHKQYITREVTFTDYYRAIYKDASITLKNNLSLISKVKTALAEGDEYLNTISLSSWDKLAAQHYYSLTAAFKAHGDFYSLAGGACAIKQAAIDTVNTQGDEQ